MSEGQGKIYEQHHGANRQAGFSILKGERGALIKQLVGTGKSVLDLGCRDGALTQYFIEGNKVLGVDVDERALWQAAQLGIEVKKMDLHGDWHELGGREFEAVVAGEVLEHLYFPAEVVAQVAKVLKSGGIFVGSVPNAFSLKNRLRYLLGTKRHTPLSDPTHINHFSFNELKHILGKEFKTVQILGLGRFKRLARWFPGFFSFDLFFICQR